MKYVSTKARTYGLLLISLSAASILAGSVIACVIHTNRSMKERSFKDLTATTRITAQDYRETVETDATILSAMASLMALQDLSDTDTLLQIMNTYHPEKTFISYLELLLPNGRLLNQSGLWFDVSDRIDFQEEAAKGVCVSDRTLSFWNPEKFVVCNGVPVVRDGETVAILYGIVSLQALSSRMTTSAYGGEAFIVVADGTTGDILLDTWHDTLGNLWDMDNRQTLDDYSFETAMEQHRQGLPGDMRFVSQRAGEIIHMHHEPVGINNWTISLGVRESVALASARSQVTPLYQMTVIVIVTLLLYLAYVAWHLVSSRRRLYRSSILDPTTGLNNRIAYERFLNESDQHRFPSALCVYIDANGLHEINNNQGHAAGDKLLFAVAQSLRKHFSQEQLYRVGGDEFVVFSTDMTQEQGTACVQAVVRELAARQYSISSGLAFQRDVLGLRSLVLDADGAMLANKRAYYAVHDRRISRIHEDARESLS